MIRKAYLAGAMLILLLSGCASDREDTQIDRLWRQGYGFNNPNPARIRNGKQPLNFDGSVHKD